MLVLESILELQSVSRHPPDKETLPMTTHRPHAPYGVPLALFAVLGSVGLTAPGQAQTTAVLDSGLGTQVNSFSFQTDPGQPDNTTITVPILGGALLTVDPSGTRTQISDFGNPAQGPVSSGSLGGMTWMSSGLLGLSQTVLVTDPFAGSNGAGALFAVNPTTGQRTLVSDFGNTNQGPLGVTPVGVAYSNGLLGLGSGAYVIDNWAGTNYSGALFEVDPTTGNRTLLSDFGNSAQGPLGVNPIALAVVPAGVLTVLGANAGLVVLDNDAGTNGVGAVFIVDCNGNRTLFSDLGNSAGSNGVAQPVAVAPQAITVTQPLLGLLHTNILLTDNEAGTNSQGALFAIDTTGNRTLASDFGNTAQGPTGLDPTGIVATADGSGKVLVTDDFLNQDPTQAQVFLVTPGGQRSSYTNCAVSTQGPCQDPIAITQW
jgi:hypothetical protein